MSCWTPAEGREIGIVEFVSTAEAHRRKGVASALLGQLVEDFTRAGGLALYLCTTNPHAGRLYESRGFRYLVGDGMRYLAPEAGEFDRDYLGGGGPAVVREATLADLPRAGALFNHPEPRWIVKDSLSRCFHDTRYESHFLKTFLRLKGGKGVCLALENAAGRLVGLATAERRDTFAEQHTAVLSFRVAPAFTSRSAALLGAAVERCAALDISALSVHAADCDEDQKRLLEEAGFAEEARYKDRLRAGGGFVDLVVYGRSSSPPAAPSFDTGRILRRAPAVAAAARGRGRRRLELEAQLGPDFGKGLDREIQVLPGMGRRDLGADARPALGDHGVEEADGEDPLLEKAGGHLLGQHGVAQHDGHDGVIAVVELEAAVRHGGLEVSRVGVQPVAQLAGSGDDLQGLEGGADDARRQGVGEQVRTGPLAQQVDDLPPAARVAAAGGLRGPCRGCR